MKALHLCHSFLLIFVPCSNVGSFPHATVLTELLLGPSHSLQFFKDCSRLLSTGAVLQERPAQAWGPWRIRNPARKPTSVWVPLSTGCSTCQEPASLWALEVPTSSKVHPPALAGGPAQAAGTQLPTMVFTTGWRQSLLGCLEAPPAPPSSLILVPSGLFLPYFSHSSLSQWLHRIFYLLLHRCQQCHWWTTLASGRSILELVKTNFFWHEGRSWCLLTTLQLHPDTWTCKCSMNTYFSVSHTEKTFEENIY